MLKINELTKRYEDDSLALDHISLDIQKGELYILLGANGAGKSTTINLICGFIPPTSGKIFINGIDALKEPLKTRNHIAYVSENVRLFEQFTGYENLKFFSELAGKDMSKKELEHLLRDIGLQEMFIHKPVSSYSKGMCQKTGIAIAMAKDADLIILDEPFSGLDPKAAFDFQRLLVKMRDENRTILMSTHNIFKAKEIADTIGIMKDGNLVMQLSRKEFEYENLERIYLDYMQGND